MLKMWWDYNIYGSDMGCQRQDLLDVLYEFNPQSKFCLQFYLSVCIIQLELKHQRQDFLDVLYESNPQSKLWF